MSRQVSISRLAKEPPVTDQVYAVLVYDGTSLKPAAGDLDADTILAQTSPKDALALLVRIPGTDTARLIRPSYRALLNWVDRVEGGSRLLDKVTVKKVQSDQLPDLKGSE